MIWRRHCTYNRAYDIWVFVNQKSLIKSKAFSLWFWSFSGQCLSLSMCILIYQECEHVIKIKYILQPWTHLPTIAGLFIRAGWQSHTAKSKRSTEAGAGQLLFAWQQQPPGGFCSCARTCWQKLGIYAPFGLYMHSKFWSTTADQDGYMDSQNSHLFHVRWIF